MKVLKLTISITNRQAVSVQKLQPSNMALMTINRQSNKLQNLISVLDIINSAIFSNDLTTSLFV
jgi:hypothetical protein